MTDSGRYYLLLIVGAIACACVVPITTKIAMMVGAIDHPDERRTNSVAIPRLGGIAIVLSFFAVLALSLLIGANLGGATSANPAGVVCFGCGAMIAFATGLIDDVRRIRARTKLLGELLAALMMVAYGGCAINEIATPWGTIALGRAGPPLTIFWIVAVTNAMNLVDGLDGLSAGISAIAFGAIGAMAGNVHESAALLSAILTGVSIGFLIFNFHPASVFMGDSGSLFLGFSIGVLTTYVGNKTGGSFAFTAPLLVALPLLDLTWAVARRYVRGLVPKDLRSHVAGFVRIFLPDRHHIHHRLLEAGLDQRRATHVLYGIHALLCTAAIYFGCGSIPGTSLVRKVQPIQTAPVQGVTSSLPTPENRPMIPGALAR